VFSFLLLLMDTYYLAKSLNINPDDIGKCMSDSRVLLGLACMLVSGHVLFQVRWCMLVPLEFVNVFLYSLCVFVYGSPEGLVNGIANLMMFLALTACTSWGKRHLEYFERMSFAHYAIEKSRRFETEFKLSQLQNQSKAAGIKISDTESIPSTTATGRALSRVGAQQLQQNLVELGEIEEWFIQPHDLKLMPQHIMGHGGFGIVMHGMFHGTSVAVKVIKAPLDAEAAIESLCNEVRILRKLRHPHIVSLYGASVDMTHGEVAVVLEKVDGMPLTDFIKLQHNQSYDSTDSHMTIAVEIAGALQYLHSRKPHIVHGDLKSANIFVMHLMDSLSPTPHAKLLDFGLSRCLTKKALPKGMSRV